MSKIPTSTSEQILYRSHPSMFRNHPIWFIFAILLSFVGVGLIILAIWWLQCKGTTLSVTDRRTTLRRGILSKYSNDVLHDHVRNIQVGQTFLQRILDVGYVGISSAGHSGVEIEVHGIPSPQRIRDLIYQHKAI